MQERLLLVARLAAPPGEKPTLARLERRAGLTAGMLKDCVRRRSVSKPVAAALLDVAAQLGLVGLTTDWLVHDRGDPPHRGGEMPPPGDPTPGSGGGLRYGPSSEKQRRVAESEAPPGFDLAEEIAQHPEQFARRMATTASTIGVELTIAFIDDAEKILRQNGLDFTAFLGALRARLRAQRPAAGGASA